MCCNTKQKIAEVLRQQMMERPFEKITVQNLMDGASMKRQSFYYHFQDTRDVLRWICIQELGRPLETAQLCLSEWLLYAMELLDQNRSFYRRVLKATHPDFVKEFGMQLFRPRVSMQLYHREDWENLDSNCQFVVDFAATAATNWMIQFVQSRTPFDPEVTRSRLQCLLQTFNLPQETVKVIKAC